MSILLAASTYPRSSGNWSGQFNAVTDMLSVSSTPLLAFGTGNFTAECFVNQVSNAGNMGLVCMRNYGAANYNNVFAILDGKLSWSNGSVWTTAVPSVPLGAWIHLAVVRNSGVVNLYQNGVNIINTTYAASITGSRPIVIGNVDGGFNFGINGAMSNVRITNTAVYTSNFTPPTSRLTNIPGTVFLSLQDSVLKDNSSNNFTINNTSVTIQQVGPFA